ncbi:hypothetical protein NE237_032007 [Protea cynaroides]|uniref:t-SNARE coiled-coil homology domain-containing protein n=1 Tax=Protea cynaroides TaxID=273540 RepID=A0A9Q0L2L2_9MAGN|nr:hypothetical protein NE237_032007 [Protea cynaroides]
MEIAQKANSAWDEFCARQQKILEVFPLLIHGRSPTLEGYIKINVDAAYNGDDSFGGIGILFRDSTFKIIRVCSSNQRFSSALEGKPLAIRVALAAATDDGFKKIHFPPSPSFADLRRWRLCGQRRAVVSSGDSLYLSLHPLLLGFRCSPATTLSIIDSISLSLHPPRVRFQAITGDLSSPLRFSFWAAMASADSWMKELNEAQKLADDINGMISERGSLPSSGPDTQRHLSAIRRKITILGTRLDSLQFLLSKLPTKQPITEKEMHRRQDMLANLKSKANQMSSALNMSNFASRDSLLGPDIKPDAMNRTTGLDNHGLVGLQRQIIKEQDEGLGKLEETVISTKHIALAVNEELSLHTALLDSLDQHVDSTGSRLQRVQKTLAILNKRTRGVCSCMCMLLAVIGIVLLAVVLWELIKYL